MGCSTGALGLAAADRALTGGELTDRDLAMAWVDPANQSSGSFSEQLRIVGVLPDGSTVYVRAAVTNVATRNGRLDVLTKIELADGREIRVRPRADRGDWDYGEDRFDLTIAETRIQVGIGEARVTSAGPGFTVELEVKGAARSVRPAGGRFERGGAYYLTTLPIPYGTLTGTLTLFPEAPEGPEAAEGEDPETPASPVAAAPEVIELTGVAFVEHRATNLAPHRMARRWFKVTHVTPEETIVLSAFERTAELGGGIQGWLLVAGPDGIAAWEPDLTFRPRGARRDEESGYQVPQVLLMSRDEGRAFRGVIRLRELTERKDDLGGLSRVERAVVRRLMKPYTFRYDDADYLFRQGAAGGPHHELRGKLPYEYQQLNE